MGLEYFTGKLGELIDSFALSDKEFNIKLADHFTGLALLYWGVDMDCIPKECLEEFHELEKLLQVRPRDESLKETMLALDDKQAKEIIEKLVNLHGLLSEIGSG